MADGAAGILSSPPDRLVEGGRVAHFGMFAGDIPDPNLVDLPLYGPFGRLRLKQWQHLAIIHPEVALTIAVVDVGYQRLGWVQIVDRQTGQRAQQARSAPWLDARISRSLRDERTWLRGSGLRVEIYNHLDAGKHEVSVQTPEVQADLACLMKATPLSVCLPVGRGRAMYSQKVPLPVEGTLQWGSRRIELAADQTTGIFDIHKAHYPHHTWWRWATLAGRDDRGSLVAINLTHNLVQDDAFHENALWIDGELSLLPKPAFDLAGDAWTVEAGDGTALRFDGDGERREDLDLLGLLRSRFRQRYGRFSGTAAGRAISGAWGLMEDHDSRW